MQKVIKFAILVALLCASACAATQVALEKKDLKVETQMSDTVFLDISNQNDKTVYLDVRNTSDKNIDVTADIASKLKEKKYTIVDDPKKAYYIVQANVLYVGKADPSALRQSVFAGWGAVTGGAVAGGITGAVTSAATSSDVPSGAGIGSIVGSLAEVLTGSITKDVTYTIVTDVQIFERSPQPVAQTRSANLKQGKDVSITQSSSTITDRYIYQTRIASSANQVNLKLDDALPPLMDGIGRAISGIF